MTNETTTNGWTEERRRAQAERIRQTRPWNNSSGPKTVFGKAKARKNALKHGFRSADMRAILDFLAENRALCRGYEKYNKQLTKKRKLTPIRKFDERTEGREKE